MKIVRVLVVCALFTTGCVNQKYRTDISECSGTVDKSTCKDSAYINLKSDTLKSSANIAFIEFNKEGKEFGKLDDMDNVTEKDVISKVQVLSDAAGDDGLLIIVFIHGWNHNASPVDTNVAEFKKFLLGVARDEENLRQGLPGQYPGKPRKVVGIYFGWQGFAVDNEVGRFLSFRNKKELGLETGANGAIQALRDIANIRKSNPHSRFITIGHSFGGGVLFSAIKKDLVKDIREGSNGTSLYGDLAVLVEPAVEAGEFVELQDVMATCRAPGSPLRMASFTSTADGDLSGLFPLGMRFFYPLSLGKYGKTELMKKTYGNYSDWIQFELKLNDPGDPIAPLRIAEFNKAASEWNGFRAGAGSLTYPGTVLRSVLPTGSPLVTWPAAINIKLNEEFIKNHNDIWQPQFSEFVRRFIGMRFSKVVEATQYPQRSQCGASP